MKTGNCVRLVSYPKHVGVIEVIGDVRETGGVVWYRVRFEGELVSVFAGEIELV